MTKLRRRVATVAIAVLVALVSTVASAYWFFPYDRVAAYLTQELERPKGPNGTRRPSGIHLSIGSLRPTLLPGGAVLRDVRVSRDAKAADGAPLKLTVSEATVRVGMLSFLLGSRTVTFDAECLGGSLQGELSEGSTAQSIQLSFDSLDIGEDRLTEHLAGFAVEGTASGEVDVVLDEDPTATQGSVVLHVQGMRVGSPQLSIPVPGMGTLNLPPVRAGQVTLEIDVEEGLGTIRTLKGEGEDVQLSGAGTLQLQRPVGRSTAKDILLRLTLAESYKDGNDITRTAFFLLEQSPVGKRYRTSDGAFQVQLTGRLGSRLRAQPAGTRSLP